MQEPATRRRASRASRCRDPALGKDRRTPSGICAARSATSCPTRREKWTSATSPTRPAHGVGITITGWRSSSRAGTRPSRPWTPSGGASRTGASCKGEGSRGRRPGIVFVFPGAGSLWRGVGRALFHREPAFRAAIERCDAVLVRHLGWSPAAELTADEPSSRIGEHRGGSRRSSSPSRWRWRRSGNRGGSSRTGSSATASAKRAAAYVDRDLSSGGRGADRRRARARKPRFPAAIAEVANEGFEVFLEVGPHPVLASTIKQCLGSRAGAPLVLASLRRGDAGLGTMRSSAAFLYARGFDIEWSRVSPAGRFVRLPGYPWQRERFWLDDEEKRERTVARQGASIKSTTHRSTVPHINGQSNGHHAGPGEGQPALTDHADAQHAAPRSFRTVVAADLGDVGIERALGLTGRHSPPAAHRVFPRSRGRGPGTGSRQGRSRSAADELGTRLTECDGSQDRDRCPASVLRSRCRC